MSISIHLAAGLLIAFCFSCAALSSTEDGDEANAKKPTLCDTIHASRLSKFKLTNENWYFHVMSSTQPTTFDFDCLILHFFTNSSNQVTAMSASYSALNNTEDVWETGLPVNTNGRVIETPNYISYTKFQIIYSKTRPKNSKRRQRKMFASLICNEQTGVTVFAVFTNRRNISDTEVTAIKNKAATIDSKLSGGGYTVINQIGCTNLLGFK